MNNTIYQIVNNKFSDGSARFGGRTEFNSETVLEFEVLENFNRIRAFSSQNFEPRCWQVDWEKFTKSFVKSIDGREIKQYFFLSDRRVDGLIVGFKYGLFHDPTGPLVRLTREVLDLNQDISKSGWVLDLLEPHLTIRWK